jgi:hypothetical protein
MRSTKKKETCSVCTIHHDSVILGRVDVITKKIDIDIPPSLTLHLEM